MNEKSEPSHDTNELTLEELTTKLVNTNSDNERRKIITEMALIKERAKLRETKECNEGCGNVTENE